MKKKQNRMKKTEEKITKKTDRKGRSYFKQSTLSHNKPHLSQNFMPEEKGIISKADLDGNDIGWGKPKELAELIDAIAYRKCKVSDILAEGVKVAAEKLGKNRYILY